MMTKDGRCGIGQVGGSYVCKETTNWLKTLGRSYPCCLRCVHNDKLEEFALERTRPNSR